MQLICNLRPDLGMLYTFSVLPFHLHGNFAQIITEVNLLVEIILAQYFSSINKHEIDIFKDCPNNTT